MAPIQRTAKLLLDQALVEEAESMQINLSRAAQAGIARAVQAEKRAKLWAEENAEVVRSSNEYIAKNGLPLQQHRIR